MKIMVVNGSPRGKASNTHVMVEAFIKGAQTAGAEAVNIFLAEKNIHHCRGCFSCWLQTPGQCVIKDDMQEIWKSGAGADILVLATPLYFDNITGMMKDFMDRLVATGDPHFQKNESGESRHLKTGTAPKLVLISNCGFPERSHFQVISHWIKRAALNMHSEVLGEIYATEGGLLSSSPPELKPIIEEFLGAVEQAGKEVVLQGAICTDTANRLAQNFIPDEIYIQQANRYFDSVLKKG